MLIKSPSIYWFVLAFYYFHATEEEGLSLYSSFSLDRHLLKLLTMYSCFSPFRRTYVSLSPPPPQNKITLKLRTADPEG